MEYKGREIKTFAIPIDRDRRKYIEDEKAIKLLEEFLDNKYTITITEDTDENVPILSITKRIWHIIKYMLQYI